MGIEGDMERIGIVISSLWLLIICILIFLKWESTVILSLNEWGDFLAGVTAPLAFLWLIVGYGLQRKELKANTEALLFQRDEMASQAKELAAQTEHLSKSAEAASDQASYVRQERFEARRAKRKAGSDKSSN